MERRKAVKKELEEMRKVDPPEERNDDIAEAIKDHWSEPVPSEATYIERIEKLLKKLQDRAT